MSEIESGMALVGPWERLRTWWHGLFTSMRTPPSVDLALAHIEKHAFREAMEVLRPLADQGEPAAKRVIGLMYLSGHGVLPNAAEARQWLTEAAEGGDVEGQHQLALLHALGQSAMEDRSSFGKWYTSMVLGGTALQSIASDDLFPDGLTVEKDFTAAAHWARLAADAGHADAQNNLGILLLEGRGIARDTHAAATWFTKAAASGNTTAKAYLGVLASVEDTPAGWERAYATVAEAAEADDTLAQTTLGYWSITGAGGRPQDLTRGITNLALAAAKGAAEAQYLMGACASEGRGLPRNPHQAETWWRRASSKNYVPAMLALGKLYSSGDLGYRNHTEAAPLLKRAAEHGIYEAQLIYGRHVLIGAGTAQSLPEAREWFEKAFAQQDTPEVRYELGRVLMWMRPGVSISAESLLHLRSGAMRGNINCADFLRSFAPDDNSSASALHTEDTFIAAKETTTR